MWLDRWGCAPEFASLLAGQLVDTWFLRLQPTGSKRKCPPAQPQWGDLVQCAGGLSIFDRTQITYRWVWNLIITNQSANQPPQRHERNLPTNFTRSFSGHFCDLRDLDFEFSPPKVRAARRIQHPADREPGSKSPPTDRVTHTGTRTRSKQGYYRDRTPCRYPRVMGSCIADGSFYA